MIASTSGVNVSLNLTVALPEGVMSGRSAPRFPQPPDDSPVRLYIPEAPDIPSAERRIMYPALAPAAVPTVQRSLFEGIAAANQSGPARLSAEAVQRCREELPLPAAYREFMAPERVKQKAAGKVKEGTLSRERYIVRTYEAFDLSARPDDWPSGMEWVGLPCGYIAGGYLDRWLAHYLAKESVSPTSLPSAWNHLRTVLNWLRKVGVLDSIPNPQPFDVAQPDPSSPDFDDDLTIVYTEDELNRLYRALAPHPDLQTALVLAVGCGARAGDLFQMRWDTHLRLDTEPAMIRFVAEKSHKRHRVPLHPIVVAHLRRLQQSNLFSAGLLFPRLVKSRDVHKDPENSAAARRRNALFRSIAVSVGIPPYEKPWQVCRATCCTRLNDVKAGIGSWVIGQSPFAQSAPGRAGTKLAADHYDNPTADVIATCLQAPQPAAWLSIPR